MRRIVLLLLPALSFGGEDPASDPLAGGRKHHGYHEWGAQAAAKLQQAWETRKFPEKGAADLPEALAKVLGKRNPKDNRPILVRFIRRLPQGLPRAPEPQERDSLTLQRKFFGEINVSVASRCFRRVEVDVSDVEARISPAVNRENAPLLVALDRDGKIAGDRCSAFDQQPILSLMQKAMGKDWPIQPVIDAGKTLLWKLDEAAELGKEADGKRRLQSRPGACQGAKDRLEAEIRELRSRRSALEKAIREREKTLYAPPAAEKGK